MNIENQRFQNIISNIEKEIEYCIDKIRGIHIDKDIPTPQARIVDYEVNCSSIFYETLRKIENHYGAKILNFETAYKDRYICGYIKINDVNYDFKVVDPVIKDFIMKKQKGE